MGVLDLELQRERRADMLREAESKRIVGRRRSGGYRQRARGAWKLAVLWAIGR